jgi:hypothetical protein
MSTYVRDKCKSTYVRDKCKRKRCESMHCWSYGKHQPRVILFPWHVEGSHDANFTCEHVIQSKPDTWVFYNPSCLWCSLIPQPLIRRQQANYDCVVNSDGWCIIESAVPGWCWKTPEKLSPSMSISHFRFFSNNVLISMFLVFITSQFFELSGVDILERGDRERWGVMTIYTWMHKYICVDTYICKDG